MLKLLLPILFPSWRFFSRIDPSPRIELGFVNHSNPMPEQWQSFYNRPEKISFIQNLLRLWFNPQWNEYLYMNSCAEHLFEENSSFYEAEIGRRLVTRVAASDLAVPKNTTALVFRLRAVIQEDNQLSDEVVFVSRTFELAKAGVAQ